MDITPKTNENFSRVRTTRLDLHAEVSEIIRDLICRKSTLSGGCKYLQTV